MMIISHHPALISDTQNLRIGLLHRGIVGTPPQLRDLNNTLRPRVIPVLRRLYHFAEVSARRVDGHA
eukprot:CAMPEP_0184717298 /NCGR_PEP_ID=MMETSP0314-20130426/6814_1 /TAXON_ID=38298 /ORGANISM="Rhodella maculata, Strain CCMP 736" /LENGTH=66 /DNA_ID=CAMNT_0027180843 /DNA_START=31 /DNA_END=227 /DNA_ORIENTATION=+